MLYDCFLGANAPLGPASSEGLYVCMSVCMSVCMYVCNTLAPLPSPTLPQRKETKRQRDEETNDKNYKNYKNYKETERVAQQLNIFLSHPCFNKFGLNIHVFTHLYFVCLRPYNEAAICLFLFFFLRLPKIQFNA